MKPWNPNAHRPNDFENAVNIIIDFANRRGKDKQMAAIKSIAAWRKIDIMSLMRAIRAKRIQQRKQEREDGKANGL